jgi:hypothetical protein
MAFATSRRRVTPTPENPKGYPSYKLEEVPSYTNRQLRYYRQSGQVGTSQMSKFQDAVKRRAALLQSLEEDGESDPESPRSPQISIQSERHWETAPATAMATPVLTGTAKPPRILTLEDDS